MQQASLSNDEDLARRMQIMDQLENAYGFPVQVAMSAIEAVGPDLEKCTQYILDTGLAKDQGGTVIPKDNCPHIEDHVKISPDDLPDHQTPCGYHLEAGKKASVGGLKSDLDPEGRCPSTENWACLECGAVRCSRYVNAHSISHFEHTKTEEDPIGHCVALSLSDLSIWCHECQAYLVSDELNPLLVRMEQLKFGEEPLRKKVKSFHEFEESENEDQGSDGDRGQIDSSEDEVEGQEEEQQDDNRQGHGQTIEINLDDIESEEQLIQVLEQVAASRGIPLDFLLAQLNRDDESDGEPVEYPFESPPESLADIANFIKSDRCRKILILAGAGMSVNSNIPDFRSHNGLYATMDATKLTASPEDRMAIHLDPAFALEKPLFLRNPLPCLELMRSFITGVQNRLYKATLAHRFVELLHTKTGKLARLYTQNIDGLEDQCQDFPKEKRIAVHGSLDQAQCVHCNHRMDYGRFVERVKSQIRDISGEDESAPERSTPIRCERCDQPVVKPGIVLFKESLPEVFFQSVPSDVEDVDLLLVIGTSLKVAPANTLVWRVPRSSLRVLVNREPVGFHLGLDFDRERDFFAAGDIDQVMLDLMAELGWLEDLEPLLRNDLLPEISAKLLEDKLSKLNLSSEGDGQENDK